MSSTSLPCPSTIQHVSRSAHGWILWKDSQRRVVLCNSGASGPAQAHNHALDEDLRSWICASFMPICCSNSCLTCDVHQNCNSPSGIVSAHLIEQLQQAIIARRDWLSPRRHSAIHFALLSALVRSNWPVLCVHPPDDLRAASNRVGDEETVSTPLNPRPRSRDSRLYGWTAASGWISGCVSVEVEELKMQSQAKQKPQAF
jgi:hypothetical protein